MLPHDGGVGLLDDVEDPSQVAELQQEAQACHQRILTANVVAVEVAVDVFWAASS